MAFWKSSRPLTPVHLMGLIRNINFNIYVCRQRGKRGGGKAGSLLVICAHFDRAWPRGVCRGELLAAQRGSHHPHEPVHHWSWEQGREGAFESSRGIGSHSSGVSDLPLHIADPGNTAVRTAARGQKTRRHVPGQTGARKKEGGGEEANSSLLCSSLDFHQRLMRCGPPSLGRAIRFSPVRVPTSSRNTLVDTRLPQTPGAGQGHTRSACKDFLEDGCQLLGDSARP